MLPQGPYNPKDYEKEILDFWINNKFYKPEYFPTEDRILSLEEMKADIREAWALICPPPNAYARPHIGNISGYAYQDAMARFARMSGKKVLVLPGKDHAGLEGEGVFVREVLEKQGRNKFDMTREDFYDEIMEFFMKNIDIARKDEREIGLSADFDRDTFTLDLSIVQTVLDTFIEMFNDGRIYKGVRIVNWDPKARTAVADNQIEYKDATTPFYYFKYAIPAIDRKVWRLNFYNSKIIEAIKNGTKSIETRVLNPEEPLRYFGEIKEGDLIECFDKNTGEIVTRLVKEARVYKDANDFLAKENFEKIFTTGSKPGNLDQLIESYNKLKDGYGNKLAENGAVAIELSEYTGDPEPEAVKIKNDYRDKSVEWVFERNKTLDGKEDLPFAFGRLDNGLEVIGVGYNDLTPGQNFQGRSFGILMRLNKKYRLVVLNPEFTGDLDSELYKIFLFEAKHYAGAHIISFDQYPQDRFYTNGFIMGTVRPETKFGDTALAVNISDERYAEFVGKKIKVKTLNGFTDLNIISDYAIEKDFGTGVVKVTPAHSQTDWEIAQRHPVECLPAKQVIGYDLRLNHLCGKYTGLNIKEARERMREDLLKEGLLIHVDDSYQNRIQIAERTKAPIEPLLSSQWYLKYDGLKEAAIEMVKNGEVKIHPETMESKFNHWMNNLRDWAISRSLWWGYRLPVWYAGKIFEEIDENGQLKEFIEIGGVKEELDYKNPNHLRVQKENPSQGWHQDENVLDTWFSSGQWVYATLNKYDLMDTFFPTTVLVSASDILENWDSRMMMFTYFKHKNIPFKNLFLTGLVLGKDGQKMSKSRGNIVDVDKVKADFGSDALRLAYFYQNSAGGSYVISDDKLKNFRNFNNKLWNASKFVLMNLEQLKEKDSEVKLNIPEESELRLESNKQILNHIKALKQKITQNINNYEFGYATESLYEEFWHTFCDIQIEQCKQYLNPVFDKETKAIISEPAFEDKTETVEVLIFVLKEYLKMLHPFIPFITEKIWQEIPKNSGDHKSLMYSRW